MQFSAVFPQRGLQAWDALVEAPSDASPENNHYRRFVEVTGPPQVLYVARPGHESPALLAALAAQGITAVEREPGRDCPVRLPGYLPYDALILDDVPGYGISNEKMETIAHYVRDTGGGLLMIGGPSSFGSGGYYKTPIERILPVDMDVKSQVQLPRVVPCPCHRQVGKHEQPGAHRGDEARRGEIRRPLRHRAAQPLRPGGTPRLRRGLGVDGAPDGCG